MADTPAATATSTAPAASPAVATDASWKPEPRQWSWKDLFTAPMLAFKPTCMLISGVTILLIAALWQFGYAKLLGDSALVNNILYYATAVISLLIFSFGATLVSVFYKADLLDDEFLSIKEGLKLFSGRIVPALLVPLFLILIVVGLIVCFWFLPGLIASIPYIGPSLYALLYPIAFALAVFVLLVGIAVGLGTFLFPGIIAIRRHGWFDNVVDTIEAVGTRPHIIVASLFVTVVMTMVAYSLAFGGMNALKTWVAPHLPGTAVIDTERRASEVASTIDFARGPFAVLHIGMPMGPPPMSQYIPPARGQAGRDFSFEEMALMQRFGVRPPPAQEEPSSAANTNTKAGPDNFINYGPGLITGWWQILIIVLILGYCLNLMLAGGMVTYLVVREDDYWDDEDLEDLDRLAKELEDEAKKEEAAQALATPSAELGAPVVPTGSVPPPTPA